MQYVSHISRKYEITPEQLLTKSKRPEFALPRHILYYLSYHRNMSIGMIQQFLRENGYETAPRPIRYGIDRIQKLLDDDPDYGVLLKKIDSWVEI